MIPRRKFLHLTASTGAASVIAGKNLCAEEPAIRRLSDGECDPGHGSVELQIIDTNVSLFHWPFRRLPLAEIDALRSKLRELNIASAWTGSFEGLLHRDIAGVNQRLAEACRSHTELIPIGSLNPILPDWKNDLRICVEAHRMTGVRLYPNYHGYSLNDTRFREFLDSATQSGLFVQIAISLEDTRTQHPSFQVADVDPEPLVELLPKIPNARIQLLNYRPKALVLERLAKISGLSFDIARIEGTDGVPLLVKKCLAGSVMFGSHAPFLIPEAALIRVHEASLTDDAMLKAILWGNAHRFARRNNS
ncbi:MAG: hypothetical protein SGI77_11125 [Pirellulaceae bacterium]|nr:hypothetical protein [Pirellulaceae bacterium]